MSDHSVGSRGVEGNESTHPPRSTGARRQFGIGEVLAQLRAEFPDISTSKIRFLEAEGLIEPARSRSGYRRFGVGDIDRLRYILTMQRDAYLPLRVIKERLAEGEPESSPDGSGENLTRGQLLDRSGVDDEELTELEDYGLIRRVGRFYTGDALAVVRAVSALRVHGVQARHLRAVKAAADREATLVEQVVAPTLRQRGPGARDAAARTAWQIADLTLRLHATLVEAALNEAGLAGTGPDGGGEMASEPGRQGRYEPGPGVQGTEGTRGLRSASGR